MVYAIWGFCTIQPIEENLMWSPSSHNWPTYKKFNENLGIRQTYDIDNWVVETMAIMVSRAIGNVIDRHMKRMGLYSTRGRIRCNMIAASKVKISKWAFT